MDFDHAIAAHSAWKTKLRAYLVKPDQTLSASEIALDNKCDLGKWLSGEGTKYANLKEYQTVRSEHTRFHKVAADVVHRANSGQAVSEEAALGAKSDFSSCSIAVVSALMALKNKVPPQVMATK